MEKCIAAAVGAEEEINEAIINTEILRAGDCLEVITECSGISYAEREILLLTPGMTVQLKQIERVLVTVMDQGETVMSMDARHLRKPREASHE